jgi:hypothetical protein
MVTRVDPGKKVLRSMATKRWFTRLVTDPTSTKAKKQRNFRLERSSQKKPSEARKSLDEADCHSQFTMVVLAFSPYFYLTPFNHFVMTTLFDQQYSALDFTPCFHLHKTFWNTK